RQLDEGAEAADTRQHFAPLCAAHQRLDALHQFVAGVDVDARIAVGDAGSFCHGLLARADSRLAPGAYGIVPDPRAPLRARCEDHVATGQKINHREPARARTPAGVILRAVLFSAAVVVGGPPGAGLRSGRRRAIPRCTAGGDAPGASARYRSTRGG